MSTHKHIDKICCIILVLTLIATLIFMNGEMFGIQKASASPAYELKLFDTSKVHKIEIIMDDWDSFIETCTNEEYAPCSVIIDNEAYKNVAIRAKGNTSLSSVRSYGNDRYSFKIEFDGYDNSKSYYGLDKLCLNNVIQDNTYMKDHLVYTMMREVGAAAPLSSYAEIYINGEYFGLYLAVESVEDSFLLRNYGKSYGELYKPDSMNMGGGRGNGKDFNPENFTSDNAGKKQDNFSVPQTSSDEKRTPPSQKESSSEDSTENEPSSRKGRNFGGMRPEGMPEGGMNFGGEIPGGGMGFGGFGNADVRLVYSDNNPESYQNIFGNAKTDVTEADIQRLIAALKKLNEKSDIENTVAIEDVIRYFVAHNFVLNSDSYTGSMIHNYYLYEENGILSMIPWDYNLAFGGFEGRSDATSLINSPIDSPVSGGDTESRPMISWIFSNEEYTNLYHETFNEFITNYFDSGKFSDFIDSTYELIALYVEKDPSKFCTYEEFETAVSTLKDFCLLRAESVSGQLAGNIPSTSEGQAEDKSSFVSAEGLTVSTMGSMGFGGGMPGGNRNALPPSRDASISEETFKATSFSDRRRLNSSELSVTNLSEEEFPAPSGFRQPPEGFSPPENSSFPESETPPAGFAPPENGGSFGGRQDFGGNRPGRSGGNMQFPGMQSQDQTEGGFFQNEKLTLILISSAVLLLGLIFAFAYRRK